MDRKLSQFFEGSPVEMAPGGTHHMPWSRRLLTVLLTMGIFLASFAAPAPARADEAGNRKLLAEFQKKADSFLPKSSILFVARKDLMDAPEKLLSTIMASEPGQGLATDSVRASIKNLQEYSQESIFGGAWPIDPARPTQNPMPVTLIITNDPDCDAATLISNFSRCPTETLRTPLPFSLEDINRATLYHEMGHAYQALHPEIIPQSDNATYTRQMEELHSDLCLAVGMVRHSGKLDMVRNWIDLRNLGCFGDVIKTACVHRKDPQEVADSAANYAISERLETGFRMIEDFMADPEAAPRLLQASEENVMKIATTIFKEIHPSEEEYNQNLETLAFLGALAPLSLKPTEHRAPLIATNYVNSLDQTLASSTPNLRKQLKTFLEHSLKASKTIQRNMTPDEKDMLPPRKKPQTP